jgi:hypothetical protein
MNKPKLGIDIDEILRAKWVAFDRYYADEFGEQDEDGNPNIAPLETYDFKKFYSFKEKEDVSTYLKDEFLENDNFKKLSPTEYVIDEKTGKSVIDDLAFNVEKKMLSGDEVYQKFLYEDFVFEIFGGAPKLYVNADVDLNILLKLLNEYFDVYLFAKDEPVTISATLFFLSKMRCEIKNIFFTNQDNEIWNKLDWVITTNPSTLNSKPENKVTVKIERMFNADSTGDYIPHIIYGVNEEGDDVMTSPGGIAGLCTEKNEKDQNAFRQFIIEKLN